MAEEGQPDPEARARIDARVAELRDALPSGWGFRIVEESSAHVAYETRPSKMAKWRGHVVGDMPPAKEDSREKSGPRWLARETPALQAIVQYSEWQGIVERIAEAEQERANAQRDLAISEHRLTLAEARAAALETKLAKQRWFGKIR